MMKKQRTGIIILEILMILVGIFFIYPVFLMFMNSFKTFGEVVSNVIALPKSLEIANYITVIEKMNYPRLFLNNLVITSIGIFGIVLFSSTAA
ncbi:MAG: carbohydrate ABC transporter permease, partial [Spirochaetales bacterium]|nr:carbohydrate ABC transporter permease [Spirochaetales bacterium]